MKRAFAPFLLLVLLLSACGGDKVRAPISSADFPGTPYEEAVAALQDAGFTNIQTSAEATKAEHHVGTVKSVTIGGRTSFSTGNSWESDVQVDIVRYELEQLEVFADVEVGGEDGKPVFSIRTNLPSGSKLVLSLSDDNYYAVQQTVKVDGDVATSEPFTDNGGPLTGGFELTVVMEPGEQGFLVRSNVGAEGQYLAGPLVQENDVDGSRYIFTEIHYDSPLAPLTEEEIKEAARSFDSSVLAVVSAAEQEYSSFLDELSSGTLSELEIYNSAQDLKGSLEYYILDGVSSIASCSLNGADGMTSAASEYMYAMIGVADSACVYLDDPKTSVLADLQSSVELVSSYAVAFVSQRFDFLSAAGFTSEEIAGLSAS